MPVGAAVGPLFNLGSAGISVVAYGLGQVQREVGMVEGIFKRLLNPVSAVNRAIAGLAATASVAEGVVLASRAESVQTQFKVFLKDGEKAKSLMMDLRKLAVETPYTEPELNAAAGQLLAVGFRAEDMTKTLRMLGDVASGAQAPFQEIVTIFRQARSTGRLFMQDIYQFANRGVPIMQELAKVFRVNEMQVRNMVSAGMVTFPVLQRVLENMTSKGGIYFDMMKKQAQTLKGLWSTLTDSISTGLILPFGEAFVEISNLKKIAQGLIDIFGRWSEKVPSLAESLKKLFGIVKPESVEAAVVAFAKIHGGDAERLSRIYQQMVNEARASRSVGPFGRGGYITTPVIPGQGGRVPPGMGMPKFGQTEMPLATAPLGPLGVGSLQRFAQAAGLSGNAMSDLTTALARAASLKKIELPNVPEYMLRNTKAYQDALGQLVQLGATRPQGTLSAMLSQGRQSGGKVIITEAQQLDLALSRGTITMEQFNAALMEAATPLNFLERTWATITAAWESFWFVADRVMNLAWDGLKAVGGWLRDTFGPLWDWLKIRALWAFGAIAEVVETRVIPRLLVFWNWLKAVAPPVWEFVKTAAYGAFTFIGYAAGIAWDVVSAVFNQGGSVISGVFNAIWGVIQQFSGSLILLGGGAAVVFGGMALKALVIVPIITGITTAVGWLGAALGMISAPIVVAIALVAALGYVFATLISGGITEFIDDCISGFSVWAGELRGIWDAIKEGDWQGAMSLVWAGMKAAWGEGCDTLWDLWEGLVFALHEAWIGFKMSFLGTINDMLFAFQIWELKIEQGIADMAVKMVGGKTADQKRRDLDEQSRVKNLTGALEARTKYQEIEGLLKQQKVEEAIAVARKSGIMADTKEELREKLTSGILKNETLIARSGKSADWGRTNADIMSASMKDTLAAQKSGNLDELKAARARREEAKKAHMDASEKRRQDLAAKNDEVEQIREANEMYDELNGQEPRWTPGKVFGQGGPMGGLTGLTEGISKAVGEATGKFEGVKKKTLADFRAEKFGGMAGMGMPGMGMPGMGMMGHMKVGTAGITQLADQMQSAISEGGMLPMMQQQLTEQQGIRKATEDVAVSVKNGTVITQRGRQFTFEGQQRMGS